MRSGSVSTPISNRNALNGDRQGPVSRRPTALQRMAKPEVAERLREPDAVIGTVGAVSAGNLSLWNQSKVPPSTITPPIELPWPPMYLVIECTTMSAPCLTGWQR